MASSSQTTTLRYSIIALLFNLATSSSGSGFSIELIHRESPKSPFYNPDLTPYQRLHNSLHRSVSRAARLAKTITTTNSVDEPVSDILSSGGSYVMNISIGTPPVEIVGIADTGSDLIWTQCKPCTDCFDQRFPLFDPTKSSTYRDVSCSSDQCGLLDRQSSCGSKGTCEYQYSYGDQSYTRGDVAVDTVSLASTSGKPFSFPKTIIGCGHNNQGTFDNSTSGIIGLGGGPISLVSQIGKDRFAYCLVPFFTEGDKTSKLTFGSKAIVSGQEGAVSTPLITNQNSSTFYYLTLLGLTVDNKRINYISPSQQNQQQGNIIIDSGTTLTFLPEDIYSQIESEVAAKIPLDPVKTEFLSLCYKKNVSEIDVPEITVHFDGDADLKLSSRSTFIRVDEETVCFAFKSSSGAGSVAIYGNLAQMDYLVGYDKVENVVAFKPTDCSKL